MWASNLVHLKWDYSKPWCHEMRRRCISARGIRTQLRNRFSKSDRSRSKFKITSLTNFQARPIHRPQLFEAIRKRASMILWIACWRPRLTQCLSRILQYQMTTWMRETWWRNIWMHRLLRKTRRVFKIKVKIQTRRNNSARLTIIHNTLIFSRSSLSKIHYIHSSQSSP